VQETVFCVEDVRIINTENLRKPYPLAIRRIASAVQAKKAASWGGKILGAAHFMNHLILLFFN
jgi:hypothetical protein